MAKLAISYPRFRHAPLVTFGRGSVRSLAECDDGATAFLLSGAKHVRACIEEALQRGSGRLSGDNSLCKPAGEPDLDAIREGATFLEARRARRIVAVGGGSVLDWARLAWAESAGILDLDAGELRPGAGLDRPEFWLLPTTCGTGAEAADVVVYADRTGEKRSLVAPVFAAQHVILDSRFLDGIPATRLAGFVSDAISHGVESYLSVVPNTLARASALSALRLIFEHFEPQPDHAQQDRLMEASFLAGVAAANCSVGIVHAYAHAIGRDGVPHGLANAAGLDAGIAFNAETPQMTGLLAALGMSHVDALRRSVQRITDVALQAAGEYEAIDRFAADPDYRAEIAERMARDVAIRSNPRRPNPDERLAFVTEIAARQAA